MIDLAFAKDRIVEVILAVGRMQKANLGRDDLVAATKSSGNDLVTEIDKRSETMIIDAIKIYYPGHGILAEESGLAANQSDYLWIIDPLDGTTNYSQALPVFAVSVALQHKGETVLGIVYAPVLDELFTAVKGQGAYLNGKRLQVSQKTDLRECVLATGFPYDITRHPINNIAYFSHFSLRTRGVRRFGAAAYDIACTAAGRFDGFWEVKVAPWDVAAGIILVEEAGGQIIHFRQDRGVSLIAGNPFLCEKILEEINNVDRMAGITPDLTCASGEDILAAYGTSHERVERAIAALRGGLGVLVTDDEDRENEGDLIFSAENLTEAQMAMLIRECSGIVCLCITQERAEALDLPMMVEKNSSPYQTAFTVSIEAAKGVSTGVSAADRVTTIKAASADAAQPKDLRRPGHIFPLVAKPGGVLERHGHTEATVELMRLAGLKPYGVLCELTNPDGSMARLPEVVAFSKRHNLPVVSVKDLVNYKKRVGL